MTLGVTITPHQYAVTITSEDVSVHLTAGTQGLTFAETGLRGPAGPPGSAGPAGATFEHAQSSPSASWTVNHNLGFYPSVEVMDAARREVEADVLHISANQLIVSSASAFTGYARCT